jgi:acetyl-CoA carboxylase biotin carboxyl carrier protein
MKIDKDKIKELVKILDELNLTELSYSDGKTNIKVGKGAKGVISSTPIQTKTEKTKAIVQENYTAVKSPMVGTAYLAPEPGAKPFASKGKKVKKGDTLLIIEAMKTMNHIQSELDGEVLEICVKDGEAIEFDQLLVKII